KLLQVLQDHEFQRIGGKDTIKVDVRVMAAAHRDLGRGIADRAFCEGLYYRLNVINISVPPLRGPREDILQLTEFLMKKHASHGISLPAITPALKHALVTYQWPGNVRELENYVRKLMILRDVEQIARELQGKTTRRTLVAVSGSDNTS